jgi:hypothetical protein
VSSPNRRWIIHLPIVAPDLDRAAILARTAARALAFLRVDTGETTVSPEDDQQRHHHVFCDRRLDDGRRCALRNGHDSPCTHRPPR